jgi:hypothetical protein
LGYPGPQLASLLCSVRDHTSRGATIVGTSGQISIHEPIICPARLTLRWYPNQDWRHTNVRETRYAHLKRLLVQYGKRSRLVRELRERYPSWSDRILYGSHSQKMYAPPLGEGLHYQVSEVNKCLRAGSIESDIMPWHESLSIMGTMDQVREQCGWPVGHSLP